jgi:cytochrome c5
MGAPRPILCSLAAIAALAMGMVAPTPAEAHPTYVTAFTTRYPTTTLKVQMQTLTGSSCSLCHDPNTSRSAPATCYRRDLVARMAAGRTIQQAINDIDSWDSDGDGIPNGVEITMPRTDGSGLVGYHPGLIGMGTDPCGDNASLLVTNRRETPCLADCNADGIVSVGDIFEFLTAWFAGTSAADVNFDNVLSVQDIFDFLGLWFTGC